MSILNPEKFKDCYICRNYLAICMVRPLRGYPTFEQIKANEIAHKQEIKDYYNKHQGHIKEHHLFE